MAFRPTPGGTASSGHGHACRTDWSVPVPASLRPWRLPLQPSHPGLNRLSPLYFSPGSLSSSVCCVCDLGHCLFPFSRWNMTPTSARAFVSSAPRCAPVATAAHAPVEALPFPARTCVGVAPSPASCSGPCTSPRRFSSTTRPSSSTCSTAGCKATGGTRPLASSRSSSPCTSATRYATPQPRTRWPPWGPGVLIPHPQGRR